MVILRTLHALCIQYLQHCGAGDIMKVVAYGIFGAFLGSIVVFLVLQKQYASQVELIYADAFKFEEIAEFLDTQEYLLNSEAPPPGTSNKKIDSQRLEIDEIRKHVYTLSLTSKVDEIIEGATSDREKALLLAAWVGTHWRNASSLEKVNASHTSGDNFSRWVHRTGACGTRVTIFVNMAEIAGLRVQRFSVYNFGKVGSGHTAAQVFWDDKWHYFDVTYAGYFEKNGEILSYEEMLIESEAGNLYDYMVPFEDFGDYYGRSNKPKNWRPVQNQERMRRTYHPENMRKGTSYGFVGFPDPVTLYFALPPGIEIGRLDGQFNDVREDGINLNVSEQLERMGFSSVPFFYDISVPEVEPDTSYTLRYDIQKARVPDGALFEISSLNCTITQGNQFMPDAGTGSWVIEFESGSEVQCDLSITHDIGTRGQFLFIDKISLFANE